MTRTTTARMRDPRIVKQSSDVGTFWAGEGCTREQLRALCLSFDPSAAPGIKRTSAASRSPGSSRLQLARLRLPEGQGPPPDRLHRRLPARRPQRGQHEGGRDLRVQGRQAVAVRAGVLPERRPEGARAAVHQEPGRVRPDEGELGQLHHEPQAPRPGRGLSEGQRSSSAACRRTSSGSPGPHRTRKYGRRPRPRRRRLGAADFLPVAACADEERPVPVARRPARGRTFALDKLAAHPLTAALSAARRSSSSSPTTGGWPSSRTIGRKRFPGVKAAFDRFYGPDFFVRLAGAGTRPPPTEPVRTSFRPARRRSRRRHVPAAGPGISIMPRARRQAGGRRREGQDRDPKDDVPITASTPAADRRREDQGAPPRLPRQGRADGDEVTKVYNTQSSRASRTRTRAGSTRCWKRPGSFERMLVLTNPYTNEGKTELLHGRPPRRRRQGVAERPPVAVFASKVELDEDYRKWFDKLGTSSRSDRGRPCTSP
jgi:hypothetical protein